MVPVELMSFWVWITAVMLMFFKVLIIFFAGLYTGLYLSERFGGIGGLIAFATDRNSSSNHGTGDARNSGISRLLANRNNEISVSYDGNRSNIMLRSAGTRSGTNPNSSVLISANSTPGRSGIFGRARCEAGSDPFVFSNSSSRTVKYVCSCTDKNISGKEIVASNEAGSDPFVFLNSSSRTVKYVCSCTDKNISGKEVVASNEWHIKPSETALLTKNYIRDVLIDLKGLANPDKKVVTLSLDDPCVFGNLSCPEKLKSDMVDAVTSNKFNGYGPPMGLPLARSAVTKYMAHAAPYETNDIIFCIGCANALEICITVLACEEEGSNILIPRPGYPLYRTIAECIGIKCKFYDLLPNQSWEIDLIHLESQIDSYTAAIIVNNPSNTCGSVFSSDHVKEILDIAEKHRLPIIADEAHDLIVFSEKKFTSIASPISDVPRLICTGIGKSFMVPGWRCGWIAIKDQKGYFENEIRTGLNNLCAKIISPCVITQAAIINNFDDINGRKIYIEKICETLKQNAKLCFETLKQIPGLKPIMPEGAFCMMVEIDKDHFPEFLSSMDYAKTLLKEQSVFCLPGECFEMPFYIRIAITPPPEILEEGFRRMSTFSCKYFT